MSQEIWNVAIGYKLVFNFSFLPFTSLKNKETERKPQTFLGTMITKRDAIAPIVSLKDH